MSLLSPQLEAFLTVAKQGTVHGAAKVLHLTQTAVTQRLRTLEGHLEASLFLRTRRGMKLTPEGEALLHYCHAAKDLEGEALANIHGKGEKTFIILCIMGPTSIMHSRVIPSLYPIASQFSRLLLQFHISDVENGIRALQAGTSQLAIVQQETIVREMAHKLLKPEEYVLVCTPRWSKRSLSDIIKKERIIDFDPADQTTFNYLKQYRLFEYANHERYFANRTDTLAMMLYMGYGYGLLTKEFCQPYIQQKQLIILNEGKIYQNQMVLAWYPRAEPPDYFTALINAIN